MLITHNLFALFFILIGVHALCDYPLQGDFLARGKATGFPGISRLVLMLAHCWIHALGVALVTGSVLLAVMELLVHWMIDELKVDEYTSFMTDQLLHVACKLFYVAMVAQWGRLLV